MTIYQVDAFAEKPFQGNPAAVCLLRNRKSDDWMQSVAQEMNLSETAFLQPEKEAYRLRWFTPQQEVKLCGHATLASAHVLWEQRVLSATEKALFDTHSGRLSAMRADGMIEMDFPSRPVEPRETPGGLQKALGVDPIAVCAWNKLWLVEVSSPGEVSAARPDFSALARVSGVAAVIVTAADTQDYDFVSRFFAPAVTVIEGRLSA